MGVTDTNGWPEYAKLVLAELKRHDGWLQILDTQINNHIQHIEHRLTDIEACTNGITELTKDTSKLKTANAELKSTINNLKWEVRAVIGGIITLFVMMLGNIIVGG